MDFKLLSRIRKLTEGFDAEVPGGDPRDVTLSQQLELLIAQGAAQYSEVVRPGRAFWSGTTAAIAAVVAVPTTAVMYAVFNNEPDGGRSIIVDWVAAQNVVSTAVAAQAQILGLVGQVREAAPTDAGTGVKKMNGLGGGAVDLNARFILNATALPATTGVAANWFPIGQNGVKAGAAATPGYGMYQRVDGGIIVAPGRYFALHVLANVVGETFVVFMGFHTKQLLLG